ncbi:ParD-like family protein [Gordonia sp. HY442]|uniref:ParD-like family protein n=1 Tax=Gordonia zhenghanii TaxID=2911516 RepID=UPI001F465042|nr:ParD-like family protein [Gordonia zhenghanii]MCF8603063.1 ParD-like family protein [Gordonia zhenghanii]
MTAASTGRSGARRKSKKDADRATRFSAELFESAQAVGEVENRSARQQLEYWAKIGRSFTARSSASRSRVEASLAGKLERQALTDDEAVAFDAEFPARIAESLAVTDVPAERSAAGFSSVYIDDDGQLVQLGADGSVTTLDADT